MATTLRWRIVPADEPSRVFGEVEFVPPAAGEKAGTTSYKVVDKDGEGWVDVVRMWVTDRDISISVNHRSYKGPHDGDALRLEAALNLIPVNFPHLRIVKEGAPPSLAPHPAVDPILEATKVIVRERAAGAFGELAEADRAAADRPLKKALERVMEARSRPELVQALAAIRADAEKEPGLVVVFERAVIDLAKDARNPELAIYGDALEDFGREFMRWVVTR